MSTQQTGFLVASACESTRSRVAELLSTFPSPCGVTSITDFAALETVPATGIDVVVVGDIYATPEGIGLLRERCPAVPVIRLSACSSSGSPADSADKAEMSLPLEQLEEGPFFRVVGWALEHKSLLSGSDADTASTQVADDHDSLEDAVWRLSEPDRERIDLIVNTSHELRTPLTAMQYGLGNLLKGVAGPVAEKQRVYLEMLKAECGRMLTTVESILNVQEAGTGAVELNTVPLLFSRLVDRCVASLAGQITDHEVTVEVSAIPGFIACDPYMMQRAVSNVLRNAVQFSPFGGAVDVSLAEDSEGWFALDIVDAGRGIEPQYLDRVTEPYFQVDGQIEGTGLGLSIT